MVIWWPFVNHSDHFQSKSWTNRPDTMESCGVAPHAVDFIYRLDENKMSYSMMYFQGVYHWSWHCSNFVRLYETWRYSFRTSRDSQRLPRLFRLFKTFETFWEFFLTFSESDREPETGTHPELQPDTESKTQLQLPARKKSQQVSEVCESLWKSREVRKKSLKSHKG